MDGTEGPTMETLVSRGRTPTMDHKEGGWVLENQSMKVRARRQTTSPKHYLHHVLCKFRNGSRSEMPDTRGVNTPSSAPAADITNQLRQLVTPGTAIASESFIEDLQRATAHQWTVAHKQILFIMPGPRLKGRAKSV